MAYIGAEAVEAAALSMAAALGPATDGDWSVPAGSLEWSCWTTVAHVAHDLTAYAGQLTGRPSDGYLPFDLVVRPGTAPAALLTVARACAGMLAAAVRAAPDALRAWHYGPTDAAGFAAMGVAEIILHTWDVTRGLGVVWTPPAGLCAAVLARLFPRSPDGAPAEVLLWSTGRGNLPGHPRRTDWVWKAAL